MVDLSIHYLLGISFFFTSDQLLREIFLNKFHISNLSIANFRLPVLYHMGKKIEIRS